jgi:hypothetical protein
MATRKKISQREAHRLRKQVRELQSRIDALHRAGSTRYPGVHLTSYAIPGIDPVSGIVETAHRLGFVVVAIPDGGSLSFHAIKK